MAGWGRALALLACVPIAAFAQITSALAAAPGQIENYNAPGNLESRFDLDCIALDAAKAEYNPVDLFRAARKCIAAKRYDDAVKLVALAMTFGRFDMLRVADQSAHQGIVVARMQIFQDVPAADQAPYMEAVRRFAPVGPNTPARCEIYRAIGHPTYYPRYMIQHGMNAVIASLPGGAAQGDGLVAGFDPEPSWQRVLTEYSQCPAK